MNPDVEKKLLAAAMHRREMLARVEAFDPFVIDSRPTEKQLEVLKDIGKYNSRYVVAANRTGKSQIGGREGAWLFTGTHPYFDAKAAWGDRPLTLVVLGQTTKQIETVLWGEKIKPFLDEADYQVHSSGGVLQSVSHRRNGNRLIFISHNNANEARKNSQAFSAQWVWLDEMPSQLSLFAELEVRTMSSNGRFICTFTPLIRNPEIKNKIENLDERYARKYKFSMMDNPANWPRKDIILAQLAGLPEGERNARLHGDWFIGDRGVYRFDENNHIENPEGYHAAWRHVEIVDPAAAGYAGYALLAECPKTHRWYVIRAEIIPGDTATDLMPAFAKRSAGVNLIRRICDPHEAWFIKEANKAKVIYHGVYNKNNNRKLELIKQLQDRLDDGRLKVTDWAGDQVVEQFISCQWSEAREDKIVRSSDYHILDCLQYFCDQIPKPETRPADMSWEQQLLTQHFARKQQDAKKAERKKKLTFGRIPRPKIYRGGY